MAAGVYQGDQWDDVGSRWQVSAGDSDTPLFDSAPGRRWAPGSGSATTCCRWSRPLSSPWTYTFGGDGWLVQLTGVDEQTRAAPGSRVPVTLRWQSQGPSPRDLTVFLHVRDAQGNIVAQDDSMPTWFGVQPTTQWQPDQTVLGAHSVPLPANLQPGVYDLVAGWYYWETLERLALLDDAGQPIDDGVVIGKLEVDSTADAPARPDLRHRARGLRQPVRNDE